MVWDKAQKEAETLESAPPLTNGGYLLRFWGKADTYPEFKIKYGHANEADLSGEARVYARWFDTEQQRIDFMKELCEFCKVLPCPTLVRSTAEGPLVKKRIIAVVKLNYLGIEYIVKRSYGYGYPLHTVIFDWEENNSSCDHNRLSYIDDAYPGIVSVAELESADCSETIQVVDFHFELLD